MTVPEYLQQNDRIGIVAPARKILENEIEYAVNFLKEQGFDVVLAPHLFSSHHQYAGTDKERAEDFQYMMDNGEVKAILCARGGYGSVRIIDKLDFSGFCRHPKWICGFSDITVFHSHLHRNYHIASLHCTMPINIKNDPLCRESSRSLMKALTGEPLQYSLHTHPLNRKGSVQGSIIGGNLSILYSLLGSPSDIETEGAILFIEDLDEYLYHIDRMMMNLKRNRKLEGLKGLIVGGMSDMHDNATAYGKDVYEIIAEHCSEYDFPLCFGFPAGHIADNYALRFGRPAILTIDDDTCELIINP